MLTRIGPAMVALVPLFPLDGYLAHFQRARTNICDLKCRRATHISRVFRAILGAFAFGSLYDIVNY